MVAADKRVGETIRGKYRVDAFLATGTMANVYAATHRNGSRVALKILHKELAGDKARNERFKREGYFANAINHAGVAKAIDDDVTEDGCAYLVMELLEGETLEQRRKAMGGRISVAELLPIADTVLDILASAHEKDVVHRDLKPDNVFITKTGEVKVLDFGVARWNDGLESSDMTGVGMVLGTPAFMPPEQALGRRAEVDAKSDLWALGATLFVCLSGESVHEGGDAKAKLIATARTPARPLLDAAPDLPRVVASVIDRALMFDRNARWPDAKSMREALRWVRRSEASLTGERSMTATIPDPPGHERGHERGHEPPPVPTRRQPQDDEPTIARAAPEDAMMSSLRNDPVFSLRREKPDLDDGPETLRKHPEADAPRSIEVSLSFTRPMPAMIMPPELGGPADPGHVDPHKNGTLPGGFSAPFGEDEPPPSPPPPAPAFPASGPSTSPMYPSYQQSSSLAPAYRQEVPSAPPAERPGAAMQEIMVARKSGQGMRIALIAFAAIAVLAAVSFIVVKKPFKRGEVVAQPSATVPLEPPATLATPTPPSPSVPSAAVSTTSAAPELVASAAPKKPKRPKRPKNPTTAASAATAEPTGDEPPKDPPEPEKAPEMPEKAPDPPPERNPDTL